MKSIILKPCPFCGASVPRASVRSNDFGVSVMIKCSCGAEVYLRRPTISFADAEAAAAAVWNRRVASDSSSCDLLREIYDQISYYLEVTEDA